MAEKKKEVAKEFVRISSLANINVTYGLQNLDLTDTKAPIENKLRVSPEWSRCIVSIKKGTYAYPKEISEWPTVKALCKDKILTIGETISEKDELVNEETIKQKEEVTSAIEEIEKNVQANNQSTTNNDANANTDASKTTTKSLEDLAK